MVLMEGFEPPPLARQVPKTCASASFATRGKNLVAGIGIKPMLVPHLGYTVHKTVGAFNYTNQPLAHEEGLEPSSDFRLRINSAVCLPFHHPCIFKLVAGVGV